MLARRMALAATQRRPVARPRLPSLLTGLLAAVLAWSAQAQSVPDAGSVLRELERPPRQPPAAPAPPPRPGAAAAPSAPAAPAAPAPSPETDVRFEVRSFALQGVTLLPPEAVQAVLAPWLNRPIDFAELEKALEAVAALYQASGWLARAQLPEQTLDERAEVRIEVLEARIGQAQLVVQPAAGQPSDATPRLPLQRLQRLLQVQLPSGRYLRMADYERTLSLLNDTSGVIAGASLAASATPGATDIVVTAQDKGLGAVAIVYDNGGSLATGADRLNAQFSADNPLQLGDQLTLGLMGTEGVEYQRLAYTLPIGYDGWRLGVNASQMRYHVRGSLAASGASGSTWVNGLNASWPWLRSAQANATLSVSADHKRFRNVVPDLSDARKTLESLQLGLSGDRSDLLGDGGTFYWSLNASAGDLVLHSADDRQADQTGPQTEGRFAKLAASLSRLQRWGSSHALWLNWNGQRASRNLDSSEKFSLGGAQGVRAYPASEASGDHGWLFSAEWRYTHSAQWQWIGFYDHGRVRLQHRAFASAGGRADAPGHVDLRGFGAALAWTPSARGSARMTVARRIDTNPLANPETGADSDGSLRRYRLWLSATLAF